MRESGREDECDFLLRENGKHHRETNHIILKRGRVGAEARITEATKRLCVGRVVYF